MPGLNWDLNLTPDQQDLARRLSFSDADSAETPRASRPLQRGRRSPSRYHHAAPKPPVLPWIKEGDIEGQEEEETPVPVHPSQCAAPPLAPVTSSATLYPSQGGMPHPHPTSAPVTTPLVHAPPVPLQQAAVATTTTSEYQRQLQPAMQQQGCAAAMRARALVEQLRLYTVAGGPVGYETKWEELHPVSQRLLLRIEEKLGEYKYQSQQLDQCSYLHDPSYNKSFELNAREIMQEVGSNSTTMVREKISIKGLTDVVKEMMWNADIALQSYGKLRPRFVHRGSGSAAGYANRPASSGDYTELNQRLTKAPTFCCYSGAPRHPSPFIQLTVARFEEVFGECFKRVEELEQLVQMKNNKSFPESLESLSKVMSNMHDYFIHVASKVEDIHQAVEAMRIQYLNDRRRWGDWNDPFVEADTRESAKQEATVRIVHPTLHLPPPSQPKTPVITSVVASQLPQSSVPIVGTFPRSCPTLPPPILSTASSLQPSHAPTTNPFSSSSITSSVTSFSHHHMEGGTAVQASTGLRTNKGRPPRNRH